MKRHLIPVLAGAIVFGGVTAFAATLAVASDTLGAGDRVVASCQDSAAVTYRTTFSGATHHVDQVTVTTDPSVVAPATAAACAGKDYRLTVSRTGALAPLELTGSLDLAGSANAPVPGGITAASVAGLSVVIAG